MNPDRPALAPAVTTYFALMEGPDKLRVIDVFTPDAVVVDDGRTYRGRDAVRTWLTGAASEFTTTSTRLSAEQAGTTATVVVLLEGDFPGGRVELTHTFELGPDGLVRALSISA
ncbi:nuclear transport factor 2 family protein [Microlunatus antarcticus]|uniref:Ketosteroid isomerase-like protein n=1 Tax=Microlunatus antarcticus TaxID=53388 RepID=A0A7W5P6B0_9ACTN|nr:nuclear transport factor 2 family protein [Microlunatus antarcticus]MBB3326197.1 ketosteroid isomerase-like protein [Microlunatus antarcticus]